MEDREGVEADLFYRVLERVLALLPFGRLFEGSGEAERGEVGAAAVELGVGGVDPGKEVAGGRGAGRERGREEGSEGHALLLGRVDGGGNFASSLASTLPLPLPEGRLSI